MKKLLFSIALCAFTTAAFAQAEFRLGAKAGVNFAKLTGDAVEDADGRTGFHIGGLVEIPISEKFSVQPELLYSQQGLQQDEDGFESKLKLDYVNIPIFAKYYITDAFSVEGGPQFGINVKAEAEFEDSDGDSETIDFKDETSGFDLGLGLGVEYRLPVGVFFGARYVFGFSNVNEDSDEPDTEGLEDDLTNSVLSLSVGYKF